MSSGREGTGGPGVDGAERQPERALKTLLVSDLVSSTRLVRVLGEARATALSGRHDRMARDLLRRTGRDAEAAALESWAAAPTSAPQQGK
jgi:hypothetical protein